MASNKVATLVLFDVGASVSKSLDNSKTFFEQSQWCLLRIIQRLIFSGENDELAIVIFGSEETDNNLNDTANGMYSNIVEFSRLQKADWDMYEKVQKLTTSDVMNSNWVEGIVVALDYLKNQSKGKRFKDKQIIVLSNFEMELSYDKSKLNTIADSFNLDNIKLVSIGIDLEEECKDKELQSQLPGSFGLMFTLIDKVENGISLSFLEAEDDIIYFKKKGKMGRFTKVNLTIGSKINIPIRWIKLNLEPTRIKWCRKESSVKTESVKSEPEIKYVMDVQKSTKFGNSKVILDYADIEAVKRQTGPASCIVLGFVKSYRIRREMFIGKDLYLVVPEKAPRAQAMLSALVDALISTDKYALVRRVSVNNGKIKLGALVPVSNETDKGICKELYFLQLPFAEYAMVVPETKLPEPNNPEILEAFDNLIDAMMITDKPKDLPMKDPTFQTTCHILQQYQTGALNSDSEDPPLPDFIQKLYDPYPELLENALPIIEKLEKLLPIQIEDRFLDSQEGNVASALNKDGNILLGKDAKSKVSSNQSGTSTSKDNTDWVNAETQEWPDELKEKYNVNTSSTNDNKTLPGLNLKDNAFAKNRYNTNYVSDRLWKQYGKDKSNTEINADVQQMMDERQDTPEVNTEEMMQKVTSKY